MNTRKWTLALTLVLLAAPLSAPRAHSCDEEAEEAPVVVREGAWLESELDSTWTPLEPGSYLLRLQRPTGAWVVETWYYRLLSDPTAVLTHDELARLQAEGRIEPWEVAETVVHQVLIYARDEAQAERLARAMRPSTVPARVVEAVLEMVLELARLEAEDGGC